TARAGNQGMAISFFNDDDQSLIELLEKRGVNFTYSDITSNGFIERKPTNKRKKRKNTTTDLDRLAWQQVKRPKKVKPGYKKKINVEKNKFRGDYMVKLGSHVSMKGKKMLLGASEEAAKDGSNTFMIYTGAPQNTRRRPIEEMNIEAGYEHMNENNISDIIVH